MAKKNKSKKRASKKPAKKPSERNPMVLIARARNSAGPMKSPGKYSKRDLEKYFDHTNDDNY